MALNEGQGRCRIEAALPIVPVRAAVELGASPDIIAGAMQAVHHVNRTGSDIDRIAVSFPAMRAGRNAMIGGDRIVLFGSESALAGIVADEGYGKLLRRGMILEDDISGIDVETGDIGTAYVRDRAGEKLTAGAQSRKSRRDERRKAHIAATKGICMSERRRKLPGRPDFSDRLTLSVGLAMIHVRQVVAECRSANIMVSTYGFSGIATPGILPVPPAEEEEIFGAA